MEKIRGVVIKAEQNILDMLSDKLPDNPFITDIAGSIRSALEETFQHEMQSCIERLKNLNSSR
jgi:uncharacterized protein YlbG (UPF0298 family)